MNNRINELRKARNMSIRELSERSSISVSTIRRIVSDKTTPNLYTLTRLAEALDCTIADATISIVPLPSSEPLPENVSEFVFGKPVTITPPTTQPVKDILEELETVAEESPQVAAEQIAAYPENVAKALSEIVFSDAPKSDEPTPKHFESLIAEKDQRIADLTRQIEFLQSLLVLALDKCK